MLADAHGPGFQVAQRVSQPFLFMNDMPNQESGAGPEQSDQHARREFLQSIGKWSGAAIVAAVGVAWLGSAPKARAGGWVNRRGGGGGWVNGGGGGGGWVNRGGGGWINRR